MNESSEGADLMCDLWQLLVQIFKWRFSVTILFTPMMLNYLEIDMDYKIETYRRKNKKLKERFLVEGVNMFVFKISRFTVTPTENFVD